VTTSVRLLGALAAASLIAQSGPALAELPEPVRAMIDAAIATGDESKVRTVIELARATNPTDGDEIDAIAAAYETGLAAAKAAAEAERHAAIRNADLLDNWAGKGELGAFRSTGNASNVGLTVGVSLTRDGIVWRNRLTARADYQESAGVVTREQYFAAYEPNYKLSERLYAYGLAQYEQDRFQGFSSRYSVSGGLGYDVLTDAPVTLSVKGGPAWRRTELVDGSASEEFAGLAAADFDWQLAETISLSQDASALVQSGSSTLVSDSSIAAKVSSDISVRLSYTIEHDTAPPPGAVKTDTLSRVTLIYDF
jgi:putative salt-induced outer membrane protein